ncbi:MAG: outer membrane protein assembly factor [Acetobacteraceae bacterium]|nr:outer membrane protein assembly factor [Acetobacteraceae bacterium]
MLPYHVEVRPTGNGALDSALSAISRLVQLQDQAPTSAAGILSRAEADRDRLPEALQSQGYWGGTVRIEIAGLPLGSPDLLDRLEATTERPVPVAIIADPGPQYRIESITVRAETPDGEAAVAAAAAEPFGLAVGDPAQAAPVLAAERTLVNRLLDSGYPLATVAHRKTVVFHDRRAMEVAWTLAPGPAATFAPPDVEGTVRVNPRFLHRFVSQLIAGETYSPEKLERARKDVMALGAFDAVRVRAADRLNAMGQLPTTFTVAERARHTVGFTAAYETNYGPSASVYWEHRNLFGHAERLRLQGEVARIGTGGSLSEMTYRVGATLRAPGLLFGPNYTLLASITALRERLEAYDRDAIAGSLLIERRLSEQLTLHAGPTFDFGASGPPDGKLSPYQIIGITFGGRYDGTDSLLDPSRGWRVTGNLTPSWSIRNAAPFAPLRVTTSTYWDVFGDQRSIIAARGTVGSLLGAELAEVPRHLRFYAGGGGSVRGYDYQSIGPRDAQGKPTGGASLVEASLELRQRVYGNFGGAVFVDAGSVGASSAPDFSNLRVGVGAGLRYYTTIGPIRADVALPLMKQTGSSGYGIYVGIGQAF